MSQPLRIEIKDGLYHIFSSPIFLLLFIACNSPERTTVSFWHVMGGPLGKRLDELICDFNRQHPEGEIKSAHMGSYDALAQKLMGAVASNSPPVIAQLYESWTDQFFKAGFLYPLENFIKAEPEFDIADFYPVFIEDNTYDSVLVTLPFNKSVPVFYYNIELLKSCGIDSFPKNWADFRAVCEKIKEVGVWSTSWPVDVWYFSTILYQKGGELFDKKNRRAMFNSSEGVEALNYIVELVKDSLFYLNPGFQRQDEFLSGNVAIIPASIVSWAFMKGKSRFQMGVAPFPQDKFRAVVIAGTNIGMFKKASEKQKNFAWKFIKWLLMPENQLRWTEASYYLPPRRSTTQLPEFMEFLRENPFYERIIEQLEFARTEPMVKEWFSGRIYLNEAVEEALRLERTPKSALDHAAKRLNIEIY